MVSQFSLKSFIKSGTVYGWEEGLGWLLYGINCKQEHWIPGLGFLAFLRVFLL